jgi:hypothetical protein
MFLKVSVPLRFSLSLCQSLLRSVSQYQFGFPLLRLLFF